MIGTTTLATSGRSTSRIGLGVATLMREPSAARRFAVLEAAYEVGIRHFDVAPLYGLGRGEPQLGEFLRRTGVTDVTVGTKFGLAPSTRARFVAPLQGPMRAAMARSDLVRRLGKKAERSGAVATPPPSLLATSVERSLDHLGLSMIDVLILHEIVWSEDWVRAWSKIQAVDGVAGWGFSGTEQLLRTYPATVLATAPIIQAPPAVPDDLSRAQRIHHSVVSGLAPYMAASVLAAGPATRARLVELLGTLDARATRLLSIATLLASSDSSIVLLGTTNPRHVREMVRASELLLQSVVEGDQTLLGGLGSDARRRMAISFS